MKNTDGNVAFIRDTFLGSIDPAYLENILNNPKYQSMITYYKKLPPNKLFNEAIKIFELFETNQIPDENLESQELELILLLSAIEDLDRENIRERTPSNNKMDRGNDER